MRCLSCESLSLKIICKTCQNNFLKTSFYKRELEKDFFVYSFYKFDEIKELLNSKYQFYGDRVFKILSNLSFKKFASNFQYDSKVYAIPIDDHTRHQFSQTAILNKSLESKNIKPIYDCLKATNIVKYAGRSLEFRQKIKESLFIKGINNYKLY